MLPLSRLGRRMGPPTPTPPPPKPRSETPSTRALFTGATPAASCRRLLLLSAAQASKRAEGSPLQVGKISARYASQLYPMTGRRLDDAMLQAESIIGDSTGNFSNLQKWVSGEFSSITKYLQKLIGTNHPMLETAKRCAYISEGRMGSAQARGLTVILTAKAVESLAKHTASNYSNSNKNRPGSTAAAAAAAALIENQISLAEMTELTYSAYMIHRGVMDLKQQQHETEEASESGQRQLASLPSSQLEQQSRGIHYGNKVSVLCGDFLLAYVMRGLGDLFSSRAVDLVASAITDFMEGEFLLLDDWRSQNYLLSRESRDFERWQRRSFATIGSLQGNTCQAALVLANVGGQLELDAREFGKNLGLAWQAHTELQPFLSAHYEPIELPEMQPYPAFDLNCLPVLLFLRESHGANRNFRLMLNDLKATTTTTGGGGSGRPGENPNFATGQHRHQEAVDYERLHALVLRQGKPIEETYRIVEDYAKRAIRHLDSFPPSQAKSVLENICRSLYTRQ